MKELAAAFKGISAIPVTPFHSDGSIDWAQLNSNLEFLLRRNLRVIVSCGNTGEAASLTLEEQKSIISFASERLKAVRAINVVGTGGAVDDAIHLARHAEKSGAHAVMVHHPDGPFVSQAGYYDYTRKIAESVGIAVVPYVRSAAIQPATLRRILELPRLVAVKFAINDLQYFGDMVAKHPGTDEFTWVCGTAEMWAPLFFALGAEGFTSGLVNVAPRLSQALFDALYLQNVREARRLWQQLKPFEDLRGRNQGENNVAVVKEAMCQLELGSRHVRPPLSLLTDHGRAEVTQALASIRPYVNEDTGGAGSDPGDFVPRQWNLESMLRGHPPRTNFNVIQLDGRYNVRIAEVTGRFPWHRHLNGDEGWLVWCGRLQIDFENGTKVVLSRGEGTWVPVGLYHSPIALEEGTKVVVFNIANFQHQFREMAPELGNFAEHSAFQTGSSGGLDAKSG